MSVRFVFPCRAVAQSASHAGGPHVTSFVVGRPCAHVRACVCACRRGAMRCEEKRPAKRRAGTLNKKKALRARRREAERAEGGEAVGAACGLLRKEKGAVRVLRC